MPEVVANHQELSKALPRKPRIVGNVISNWGAYALAMGVNFFLSPYVVRHIGNTGYGVWTLILSLTGYLGLLDLGVRGAVTRYVAKFHTEAAHDRTSNVASSAMLIFSAVGMVAILASLLLAAFVVGRLQIPPQYLDAARLVLVIIGLNIATSLVNGVFGGILVGLQRFDLTNGIEIANNVLRAVTIVVFLRLGYGIVTLALIQLGFTLARLAASMWMTKQLYPELQINYGYADRAGIRLIFSFSVFSFLLHVSGSLIYASDNVVIGAFLPVSAVTFYAIGGNLVEYTRTLVSGISQTMTPLASSTEARRDQNRLEKVILFSSRAGTMVVLPIALTLAIRGSSFISLWMGPQYAELSGKVAGILSLTLLLWAANSVTGGSLLGLSKHRPLVPMLLAEGVCNLVLSILLVKRMGIVGVAWGTVIPSAMSTLFFWPWYIRRAVGIRPMTYMVSAWVRPILAIVPFAAGTYAIEHYWGAGRLLVFFSQVALILPLALLGYWLVCLDEQQREEYSRGISRSLVRVFARG
jgi:O-antigen/teichoic acid export membrane protein